MGPSPMNTLVQFFQQNAGLLTAFGGIATVFGVAFGFYKDSHDKLVQSLESQIVTLERKVKSLEEQLAQTDAHDLPLENDQLKNFIAWR